MTEDKTTITTGTPIPANYRSCMNDVNKLCQCTGTACMGSITAWNKATQNQSTTITDNETIARFMGYEYQIEEWCGSNILKDDLFSETGKSMQPFNPDESWSDLMPVWYKFKDLDSYSLELSEWSIYRYYWNTIANDIPRKPIADVCKLLAEGIRWYNSTQNKEQS